MYPLGWSIKFPQLKINLLTSLLRIYQRAIAPVSHYPTIQLLLLLLLFFVKGFD